MPYSLLESDRDLYEKFQSSDFTLEVPASVQAFAKVEEEQKEDVLIKLKELHSKQQAELVKGINYMAEASSRIINDINSIEKDLDNYQSQIDDWISRITATTQLGNRIVSSTQQFQIRCQNLAALGDLLTSKKNKKQ